MTTRRAKVGDRVVALRSPVGPASPDLPLTGDEMRGTVTYASDAKRGHSAGTAVARVRWDNGHESRHSLGMIRVVEDDA